MREVLKGWGEHIGVSFNSRDWSLMKSICQVLRPFKSATNKLSEKGACISMYIPTLAFLFSKLGKRNIILFTLYSVVYLQKFSQMTSASKD